MRAMLRCLRDGHFPAFAEVSVLVFTPFFSRVRLALLPVLLAACAAERVEQTPEDTSVAAPLLDDFRHEIPAPGARRVASLNPAMTELILALGAGDRLVGRTSWDTYSPRLRSVRDLGAGLRPNVEAVLETRPDLVILYASNDNAAAANRIRASGVPTLSIKLDRIAQFERAATLLGTALDAEERARFIVDSVQRTLDSVRTAVAGLPRPRVFWHVWDSPIITIGSGSFLHDLVEIAGGANVYGDVGGPSPQVELEDIAQRAPDVVLAGPAGARRIRSDPRWQAIRAVRNNRVIVVDTLLVARPSVRLGEAAATLATLLHPTQR
jgi:iron complex transport system substrate-binding protein